MAEGAGSMSIYSISALSRKGHIFLMLTSHGVGLIIRPCLTLRSLEKLGEHGDISVLINILLTPGFKICTLKELTY